MGAILNNCKNPGARVISYVTLTYKYYLSPMKTFANLVEEVKNLSFEEKEDLHLLLDKILADERRAEILANHQESLKDLKEGKLSFYDKPEDLLNHLNEE